MSEPYAGKPIEQHPFCGKPEQIDIVERLRETIVAYDEWYQGRLKTSDTLLERFSCERKEAADEITRLRAENEKLRKALKSILNDVGYHNPMRMTTEISDKILEDAAGALNDNI